jgi:hypothetical protein
MTLVLNNGDDVRQGTDYACLEELPGPHLSVSGRRIVF